MSRVLILVENLSVPFDRRVWQESQALVSAGYEVVVICPMGSKRDTEREVVLDGVRILRYPLDAASGGPAGYVREYAVALWHTTRLALKVRREGPVDVVQACNPPDLLFLPALPLMARGAKFVFDQHDLVPELFRSRFAGAGAPLYYVSRVLERITFALADAVISMNGSYRRVALTRGHKASEVVHVVRSAPDLTRFHLREPDPSLRRGKRHLAAYVGVMGPQDGVDYALRALAHLHHEMGRDDLHTIFMGSGDSYDDMVALARDLGLADVVEFPGRVSDEFLQRCLSTADVGLSPDPKNPLNDVSAMNKVVEYMAMGRPLVSFDLTEAQITAGEAAVYAPADDEHAFAKKLDELLDDPVRRAEMGVIGRSRVTEDLSWAVSERNLIALYEQLVGPARAPAVETVPAPAGNGAPTGRLGWYASRLRAMGPRELAWRAGTKAVAIASPVVRARRPEAVLDEALDWPRAFANFRAATDRPVVLDEKRAVALHAAVPAEVDAVVAAAEQVVHLTFGFFGQEPVTFPGDRIDWNLDPRTGYRWPLVPASRIDHRTHPGDPKWIWELNRLQHLPWLAQAWLFTGDRRFADVALEQLDGWMEQNPEGRGIAWRGGFEAGVRALSVAIAVQGLRDAPGMTLGRYQRVVTLLAASARMAWRERSRFSSANNHLLGEMAGVATVAMLFPEIAGSARARTRAVRVLTAEAARQILPDGMGAEQSFAYQSFASDLLAVPAALLRLRGDRVPTPIVEALRRGAEFQRFLVAGGDPAPRYGDDDGGFALRLHADPTPTLRRHLATAAVATGDPADTVVDLAAAWLAGTDASLHRSPPAPGVAGQSRLAPDGGLVVLRRDAQRVMMDVGPLGYLSIAAHGHADALAVTVSADGRDVIGDPGTGSYYAEPEWRTAFRGTRMHATVSVDDLDQSVMSGPFLWARHAVTTVRAVDLAAGVVEAEHEGYTRLAEAVTHRRYLIAAPGTSETVVVDLVTGTGSHRVRTAWPLAPDLAPDQSAGDSTGRVTVRRGEAPVLTVTTAATAPVTAYAVCGDEQNRLGWWSDGFESRVPAWLIGTVVEAADLPLVVATVLAPPGAEPAAELAVRLDGTVVEVVRNGSSIVIDTGVPGAVTLSPAAGPAGAN